MEEKLPSGHTSKNLEGEEDKVCRKFFFLSDGAMRLQPDGWILPRHYLKFAKSIQEFEVRPSDVYISGFPKSGTTWIGEIIWNMLLNPNVDNPDANISFDKRVYHLDGDVFLAPSGVPPVDPESKTFKFFRKLYPNKPISDGMVLHLAPYFPSPRLLKTHLPISMLPNKSLETSKVVHIVRDPRDVIISYYKYSQLPNLLKYEGELEDFIDSIVSDLTPFSPYWSHLKQALELKDHPNMYFLYYEDLKSDTAAEVKRLNAFLGTNLDPKQIDKVIHHTSFAQMKERFEAVQPQTDTKEINTRDFRGSAKFLRKGEIGDWKNKFTEEQIQKVNSWIAKNVVQFEKDFKYKNI